MTASSRAGASLWRLASRGVARASLEGASAALAAAPASTGANPTPPAVAARALAAWARGFAASAGPSPRVSPADPRRSRASRRFASASGPRLVDERFAPVLETPEMDAEYEKLAREIAVAPKKRQRFLLTEALKGTRLKPLITAEHELMKEDEEFKPRALQTRVIDVNRTCKVTKGGGLMNFTALVVVGDGDGVVGFATGKGKDVGLAVEKAYLRATRSLVYIERFEKSTIFHAQEAKHCKTKIRLMPARAGDGLKCNQIVESICEMAGITDISAKVIGSHHPHNTVRACFEALESIRSPADVAAARGVTVYRI